MMNEYLLEPFLTRYYLLESICGSFMTEKAKLKMFKELAKIFCLGEDAELKQYYDDSALEHFSQITDSVSYDRFCRTVEYAQKSGQDIDMTDRDRMILAQKRAAMSIKSDLFKHGKNLTRETVSDTLWDMARLGSVDAMLILSYMEYHGICVCKDTVAAVRRIRLCAKWNDLFGNLMGITYDEERSEKYFNILGTSLRSASQRRVFEHICKAKGHPAKYEKDPIARVVDKAFGLNIAKRDTFDRVFAKIAFSDLISSEDKEKLLLNKQSDALSELSNIPVDVECEREFAFDPRCTECLPLKRSDEVKKILQNITVAQRCSPEVYSPLLVVTYDEYITDMYKDMLLRGFDEDKVVEIDAATLTEQDFIGGKENVILRGLSETKSARTVFVIDHCEELEGFCLDELVKMLDNEYRRKFKLFRPPVSLDLSGLVFMLFAGERNSSVKELCECCDTVWTERITSEEKGFVVGSVFEARAKAFGCDGVKLNGDCKKFLEAYDTKQMQQILDGVLRRAVFEESDTVTLEAVKDVCREQSITATRKGFGYMGGKMDA